MSVMTPSKSRTPPIGPGRSSWRGLMPLIAVVVVTIVGLGVWLLLQDGDRTPTDVVQDVATAMRNDDMTLLEEVIADDVNLWFFEWQIALRAEPEFTDCTEQVYEDTGTTRLACTVRAGDEFFYTQIADEPFTSTISGTVGEDGTFLGSSFPPYRSETTNLEAIEAEFRTWVQATYPDLEDDLYGGNPGYIGLKMTRESGELRMDLLDEFLASRG